MTVERLGSSARDAVERAQEEARRTGSRTVEPEHLLLALAAGPLPVADALAAHGFDRDRIARALALEEARALEVVGVSAGAYGAPPRPAVRGSVRLGTSAKRVLEQTLRLASGEGTDRAEATHLLLTLLLRQEGTLARALALADGDTDGLIRRTHELCRAH